MVDPALDISGLPRDDAIEVVQILDELDRRKSRNRVASYYPDSGPLRRELYTKHTEFFAAGSKYTERAAICANRVGKTEGIGAYECTLHLTGEYPEWWQGRRFNRPVSVWACGTTVTTTRDIVQAKLVGPKDDYGTGMIPADKLGATRPKGGGVPDALDTVLVKNKFGGYSKLTFKSYESGRKAFEGTEQDVIWLDEECPLDVYMECLTRTMTVDGLVLLTFTPLAGLTETVLLYMPGGEFKEGVVQDRFVVMATWDDAPHLSEDQKTKLYNALPPHQRDARSKGIPQLGSGAIYPVPETEIIVDDFQIPEYWPRGYALDVGWNRTAALWGAHDKESDIVYLFSEHYRGQAEPAVHAAAIRARGDWMKGVIDPAARGRGQKDGAQLLKDYRDLGLKLTTADNALESGIYQVWSRLSTGRLKVFKSLQNWRQEYRLYRRDEKGRVMQGQADHLMDDTRYMVISGLDKFGLSAPEKRVIVCGHRPLDAVVGY